MRNADGRLAQRSVAATQRPHRNNTAHRFNWPSASVPQSDQRQRLIIGSQQSAHLPPPCPWPQSDQRLMIGSKQSSEASGHTNQSDQYVGLKVQHKLVIKNASPEDKIQSFEQHKTMSTDTINHTDTHLPSQTQRIFVQAMEARSQGSIQNNTNQML